MASPKTPDDVFDDSPQARAAAMSGSLEHDPQNDPDVLTSAAQGRLKSFFERLERLAEDKKAVSTDMKEVFAEAKGEGFDTAVIRIVLKRRAQDKVKREELEALVDLYEHSIGGL